MSERQREIVAFSVGSAEYVLCTTVVCVTRGVRDEFENIKSIAAENGVQIFCHSKLTVCCFEYITRNNLACIIFSGKHLSIQWLCKSNCVCHQSETSEQASERVSERVNEQTNERAMRIYATRDRVCMWKYIVQLSVAIVATLKCTCHYKLGCLLYFAHVECDDK